MNEYLYIVIIYQSKACEKGNLMSICRALSAHIYVYHKGKKVRMTPSPLVFSFLFDLEGSQKIFFNQKISRSLLYGTLKTNFHLVSN